MSCECGVIGAAEDHERYCAVHPESALKARIEELEGQLERARVVIVDLLENHENSLPYTKRPNLNVPEDHLVLPICEKWGYGAVMNSASRLWYRKDPFGAQMGGPCVSVAESSIKEARKVLSEIG